MAEPPDELRGEVERRLEDAAAAGFSGTAMVVVDGVTLLERGYGLADRENGVPNGPRVAYDFGSVLKCLTAAAIFKLAGEGELAVADSLATLFDEVPRDKAEITILQIIQHRAGFHAYHDTEGDFEPMTRLEARQRIFAQELLFEPGSAPEYSNSGYTLLADIVETVSGREFTDYVTSELLAPASIPSRSRKTRLVSLRATNRRCPGPRGSGRRRSRRRATHVLTRSRVNGLRR